MDFGFTFVALQYLQGVRGYSPLVAALSVLPLAMAMMPTGRVTPKLVARFGARGVCAAGLVLVAAGLVVISRVGTASPYWLLLAGLIPVGIGMGAAMTPATAAITEGLPAAQQGVGSALNDLSREVGGALGIAVVGSIVTAAYRASLHLTGIPPPWPAGPVAPLPWPFMPAARSGPPRAPPSSMASTPGCSAPRARPCSPRSPSPCSCPPPRAAGTRPAARHTRTARTPRTASWHQPPANHHDPAQRKAPTMTTQLQHRPAGGAPRVMAAGAGFGGLTAARRLARTRAETTLIDRNVYSTFQPLPYQLATGGLATPGTISRPPGQAANRPQAPAPVGSGTQPGLKHDGSAWPPRGWAPITTREPPSTNRRSYANASNVTREAHHRGGVPAGLLPGESRSPG